MAADSEFRPHSAQPGARLPSPGSPGGAPSAPGTGRGLYGSQLGQPAGRARWEALAHLLGDAPADPLVLAAFRAGGRRARPALLRAARDADARRRVQARALLLEASRADRRQRLLKGLATGRMGLEVGLLRLSQSERPELDARPFRLELERLAERVRARERATSGGFAGALALLEVLGKELGLTGGAPNPRSLDELFIETVLSGRRGLPLPLVALHLLVAQRCGIRAAAVPLPGRVLLRLYSGERTLLADPFAGGKLRTRRECLSYLESRGLPARPEWFLDATPGLLLQRHLLNLEQAYRRLGRGADADFAHRAANCAARGQGRPAGADPEGA